MLDSSDRDHAAVIVSAFLDRYLTDLQRGRVEPLEAYQAAYPGYEDVIASEYRRLAEAPSTLGVRDSGDPPDETVLFSGESVAGDGRALSERDWQDVEVDNYQLFDVLGRGGMGIVYVAEQQRPVRRRVALKVIKPGMDTKEVVARFESERQALALMEHQGIAKVYDAGATASGLPYFAMEYVEGKPITEFCDEHRLSIPERLRLFLRVCKAVQHAHQKGIIHRDIKPPNVIAAFEGEEPVVKVIDFGIAKSTGMQLTEKTVLTEVGQIVGTLDYMSPEQANFKKDIDTRTDIYSLGILLYELMVGQLPMSLAELPELSLTEMIRHITSVDPPKPSTRRRAAEDQATRLAERRRTHPSALVRLLRGDLDAIVMKAIEKDRRYRYASASEFAADIERHLNDEPVLAATMNIPYRVGKFTRRHRVPLSLAAVALALLVGTFWVANIVEGRKRTTESVRAYQIGESHFEQYRSVKGSLAGLEKAWKEEKASHREWEPVWNRQVELEKWHEWQQAQRRLPYLARQADLSFRSAFELAPPSSRARSEAKSALEALYRERSADFRWNPATFDSELFVGLIKSLDAQVALDEKLLAVFEGKGEVSITSDPPGAEVYCFRYEMVEGRLFPLPFDPASGYDNLSDGLVGQPFLQVERLWADPDSSPFQEGDRLLRVRGKDVHLLRDLVHLLKDVDAGEQVAVAVTRASKPLSFSWTPFPETASELSGSSIRTINRMRDAFGLSFSGFPLDFVERCHLGTTTHDAPLKVPLPQGSYLLVFKKAGLPDVRFPVQMPLLPDQSPDVRLQLVREKDIPPGFIYIPRGRFQCGGDAGVDQGLERGYRDVDGFFISRLEVTFGDYLEFINSLEEEGRIKDRRVQLLADLESIMVGGESLKTFLRRQKFDTQAVRVIPEFKGVALFTLVEGRWDRSTYKETGRPMVSLDWPVFDVSLLAALEYAEWLATKLQKTQGKRWRFELPSDLQWEKAARGVDGRSFVWGNYHVWNFCRCPRGQKPRPNGDQIGRPEVVGAYPMDESVYGVRDCAGGVNELCRDSVLAAGFSVLRGGDWGARNEPYFFRVTNRNGRPPHKSASDTGIRLVALPLGD